MRAMTVHESVIRKALPYGANNYDGKWTASGDGYECESVHLTEDEAAVVDEIAALVLCVTCEVVIEDGDRKLVHRHRTYCEKCGTVYLRGLDS